MLVPILPGNHNSEVVNFLAGRSYIMASKKQTIVADFTTEAEYVAAASFEHHEITICIVKNPMFHSKTKHIEIMHHFIRDAYEKKLIQVLKIHTDNNVADLLTKGFDAGKFQFLVVTIGMMNP
ncbi:hypothetical protein Tco_0872430 [Tanacetum coccineum]